MNRENNLPRCPECGAPAGMDCRTIQGPTQPHGARLLLQGSTPATIAAVPAWLEGAVTMLGVTMGKTGTGWVDWNLTSPATVTMDGDFTARQLRDIAAMMEANTDGE
jgi:hypothetical protein